MHIKLAKLTLGGNWPLWFLLYPSHISRLSSSVPKEVDTNMALHTYWLSNLGIVVIAESICFRQKDHACMKILMF